MSSRLLELARKFNVFYLNGKYWLIFVVIWGEKRKKRISAKGQEDFFLFSIDIFSVNSFNKGEKFLKRKLFALNLHFLITIFADVRQVANQNVIRFLDSFYVERAFGKMPTKNRFFAQCYVSFFLPIIIIRKWTPRKKNFIYIYYKFFFFFLSCRNYF